MLLSQTVDGVLHGVGRQNATVVTSDMSRFDVALEQHLNREVQEIVTRFGSEDLRHPDIGLTPSVLAEPSHQLPR